MSQLQLATFSVNKYDGFDNITVSFYWDKETKLTVSELINGQTIKVHSCGQDFAKGRKKYLQIRKKYNTPLLGYVETITQDYKKLMHS